MTWLEDAARRLAGGRLEVCYVGHGHHAWRIVDTTQGPLEVFDAAQYRDMGAYCTGDDHVSRMLLEHGTWEPHVLAALDELGVLDAPEESEVVLDFGCQVGWYARHAADRGFHVLALDGDGECLDVCAANVARAAERADRDLVLSRGWLDERTRTLPLPADGTRVRLVKADVESSECHVVRACSRLLDAGVVEWILLEISPVFRDDYREEVLVPLLEAGYSRAWRLHGGLREWADGWPLDFPQEEILFARP